MKKVCISILLLAVMTAAVPVYSQEAGTGFSVFVPECLYLGGQGSVSLTSGLSTSIGLGDYLSIPVGFDYCKLHGLKVEGVTVDGEAINPVRPWFVADSFLPYIKLQLSLPLGPVTLSAFGGGAVNLNASLSDLRGNAALDMETAGGKVALTQFSYQNTIGFGWLAGGSVGLTFGQITIRLTGEYRSVSSAVELSAAGLSGTENSLLTQMNIGTTAAKLVMRGFVAGIGGSFAF